MVPERADHNKPERARGLSLVGGTLSAVPMQMTSICRRFHMPQMSGGLSNQLFPVCVEPFLGGTSGPFAEPTLNLLDTIAITALTCACPS
jgi:hypothetical protein